jgi:retron-type reverse transcriptase
MFADLMPQILSKRTESNALLRAISRRIIWKELSVSQARSQLLDYWLKEWETTSARFDQDQSRILADFRISIANAKQRDDASALALYLLRSLLSAREANLIYASNQANGDLISLLGFLEKSRLPEQFTSLESALRCHAVPLPGVFLAKEFLSHSPFSEEFLTALLAYSVDINGVDDFLATIAWNGWAQTFSMRKSLGVVWPVSLRKNVNSDLFNKLPLRIQQELLANESLGRLCFNSTLLKRAKSTPLSFKNSRDKRIQTLSQKRFLRQPWRTFSRIVEGTVTGELLDLLWVPEILNRLKPKMRGLWSLPWIYTHALSKNLVREESFWSGLNPEIRSFLKFLEAGTPEAKIGALTQALRDVSSFPVASLQIQSIQALILSIPERSLERELLSDLTVASPLLWQKLAEKLPQSLLNLWCGPTDSVFLRWLFGEVDAAPAPYLAPFRNFIIRALESKAITFDVTCLAYLNQVPIESLPNNPSLASGIRLLSLYPNPKVARWFKAQWKAFAEVPPVRGELSKLVLKSTPQVRSGIFSLLRTTHDWLQFMEETGLLAKGATPTSIGVLKRKAWKGSHSVARELLSFVLKSEGRKDYPKIPKALESIMLTDVRGFAEELARFYPNKAGYELWMTTKKAMLLTACGSPRTVDWIAKNVPHAELHSAFEEVRASLSSRPTLSAAIELATRVGIRNLPQITRLAFKRWSGSPKENRGKAFDDLYYSWPLPKKAGGTRTITAPAPDLKRLQRLILDKLLEPVPINDCVHGFIKERSSATNARFHTRKQVVAKLDIRSFFPSTPYHLIVKALRTATGGTLSQGALFLLADICSYQGGLPVGAPSSPTLGNIILSRFDEVMADRCAKNDVFYTRYADDLVFSGDNRAVPMLGVAKRLLKNLGYQTDSKKELIMRRGMRQSVTGLVVNEEANMPRRQRRRLRAAMHSMAHGKDPHWHGKQASKQKIIGVLNYLRGVHRESAQRLSEKYLPTRPRKKSP